MTDARITGGSPEDAFGLVADETRFGILRALWDADDGPSSFSDLRESVGISDSGQFNYHLDKLTPEFVRRVDDGYELTYAGRKVIGAAVSGTYTHSDITVDPVPVSDCPACASTIEARYDRGFMKVACDACGMVITNALPAPPIIAANHDPEALPGVVSQLLFARVQAENRGFCQLCGGPIAKSLAPERRAFEQDSLSEHLTVTVSCRTCGAESYQVVGWTVVDHPAVVGFLYDHGIDLRETPVWALYDEWLADPHASVASEDPLRVETAVELGGDRLELTLDREFAVVDHRRT
jgi:hypothetical protein